MPSRIRRIVGSFFRGVIGYFENNFESVPSEFLCNPVVLGFSINNLPIHCYKVGNGSRKLLFCFGIHGNEVGTVKLAYKFLAYLLASKQLERNTIYIIPCLNPDGYALAQSHPDYLFGGRTGRFNSRNVDLNRNFDVPNFKKNSVWSFGKNYSEQRDVFCGDFGNSEPETKTLTSFIQSEGIGALYMFHNAGKDVTAGKDPISQGLAQVYAMRTGFRLVREEEWLRYNQSGTAKEWCEQNAIPYVEIEGSRRWGSDWNTQKEALLGAVQDSAV